MSNIEIKQLGRISFERGIAAQMSAHAACIGDPNSPEVILICEHESVITSGKSISPEKLAEMQRQVRDIPVVWSDRGGLFTAHNPGQIVIYPIVRVGDRHLGARAFIEALANSVIDQLSILGIRADYEKDLPGVWVNREKIAAIGVRIDRRVSRHGIAINVSNDLSIFSRFTPCGISDRKVTKLASHVPVEKLNKSELELAIAEAFIRRVMSMTK